MNIIKKQSPNYNDRIGFDKPFSIILHYTGVSAVDADNIYMSDEGQLSPHYMVDIDGSITQYVHEDKRAWHAGQSYWGGCVDMNSHSIGIEIVNGGHDGDLPEFPVIQMDAVISLCRDILVRHDISPFLVLGHSDIAPGRKLDPGEVFPWEYLAQNGVGFWPLPVQGDFDSDIGVRSGLEALGYTRVCEDVVLVREFQRHYEPELFQKNLQGQVSERTRALIACLLREKLAYSPSQSVG